MFIFGDFEYFNPIETISAFDNKTFIEAIKKIELLKEKYYLGGYISYQSKDIFLNKKIKSKKPLLVFRAFKDRKKFEIDNFQEQKIYIKENINYKNYVNSIKKIKEYILNGATYEVNYTFSNDIFTPQEGFNLFKNLLNNQKTEYCAYIKDDFREILSFSPELFFEIENGKITTKPMKGTVKRGGNDKKEIDFLKNDIKNKAENTMIVDLLRNDLSKIKESKNIKVEKLFEIETHKTLHQMTSTISAELEKTDLSDILSCLFPCGSITGAPKISTMEIIDKVENYKRDIYCGALGVISREKTTLSIPIRILEKDKNDKKFSFCQGGAIILKSSAKDEFQECRTKKLFLGENLNFNLIETFLNSSKEAHFARLKKSADELGFKINKNLFNEKFKNDKIIRILLNKNGDYEIQYKDLTPSKTNKIELCKEKMYSKNSFLFYKTDFKPWYQKSYEKIAKNEIFDTIFINEKNELTEGSRSNIILKLNNILYTPPVFCGLLDGIKRQELLKNGSIKEKILYLEDLKKAQKIFLINSIRGIVEVEL